MKIGLTGIERAPRLFRWGGFRLRRRCRICGLRRWKNGILMVQAELQAKTCSARQAGTGKIYHQCIFRREFIEGQTKRTGLKPNVAPMILLRGKEPPCRAEIAIGQKEPDPVGWPAQPSSACTADWEKSKCRVRKALPKRPQGHCNPSRLPCYETHVPL